jgi:hypothetical protein
MNPVHILKLYKGASTLLVLVLVLARLGLVGRLV